MTDAGTMRKQPRPDETPYAITSWSDDGTASFEARGVDDRAAIEAGLRAILSATVGLGSQWSDAAKSAPIRGEGPDLAAVFAALADDLLDQIAQFGSAVADVTLDGVLRRDDGGYVAWGYAAGQLGASAARESSFAVERVRVERGNAATEFRATLRRR